MRVGFTGTRDGMTVEQHKTLCGWLRANGPEITELHHGCCVGADDEAWDAFKTFANYAEAHAHPSNLKGMTSESALYLCDVKHDPKPPLDRNRDIVDSCDLLIACPKGDEERRSGTWATVRYARKVGRQILIIAPDGSQSIEFRCSK